MRFGFVFKDGQWVMRDTPLIDLNMYAEKKPREFLRKLVAENQDVKTLLAYIKPRVHDAFSQIMKVAPMKPPKGYRE